MLRRQSRNDSPAGYKERKEGPLQLPRRGRERKEKNEAGASEKEMTKRREKTKPQKPQLNKQLEMADTEQTPRLEVNQRQEKLANFLIDVAKYVFTGVIITSLFNDVSDKTILML